MNDFYVVSVAGPKMYKLNENVWSEVTGKDTQLYQYIKIDGNTLFFDAFDVTGNVFDSFRLIKNEHGVNTLIENPYHNSAGTSQKLVGQILGE